jgi:hypothetical protein
VSERASGNGAGTSMPPSTTVVVPPVAAEVPPVAAVPPTVSVVPPVPAVVPPVTIAVPPITAEVPAIALVAPPVAAIVPPVPAVVPPVTIAVPPITAEVPAIALVLPPVAVIVPPVTAVVPPATIAVPPITAVVPPVALVVPPITVPESSLCRPKASLPVSPPGVSPLEFVSHPRAANATKAAHPTEARRTRQSEAGWCTSIGWPPMVSLVVDCSLKPPLEFRVSQSALPSNVLPFLNMATQGGSVSHTGMDLRACWLAPHCLHSSGLCGLREASQGKANAASKPCRGCTCEPRNPNYCARELG